MATLITDILNRCARQCSISLPDNWISASESEHVELRDDFLSETALDCLERADWPSDIGGNTTITGPQSGAYTLDMSFLRLARNPMAVLETTDTLRRPLISVKNEGDWQYINEAAFEGLERYYYITGQPGAYEISFYPEIETGEDIFVTWVSENWVESSAGSGKALFTDVSDVCRLPRRLVESGVIWRFRERYGLEYGHRFDEYERLMARYITDIRGRNPIVQATRFQRSRGVKLAYPWEISS